MRASEAIQRIQNAGFHYIKVELEAEVDYSDVDDEPCPHCQDGFNQCEMCLGSGEISVSEGEFTVSVACDDCDNGQVCCEYCDGTGRFSPIRNGSDRERVEWLGAKLKQRFNEILKKKNKEFGTDTLRFYRPYVDGSVNTEITFTLDIRCAGLLPKMLQAFHELCNSCGGYEVDNAGMHMAILETDIYPGNPLPHDKISRFRSYMNVLVPFLYAVSTSGGTWTRPLRYRDRYCSHDHKYSAIYTRGDVCIEYRIFDACYANPERVLSFLGVIARSLVFYTDGSIPTEVEERLRGMYAPNIAGYSTTTRMYESVDDSLLHNALSIFCSKTVISKVRPLLVGTKSRDKSRALQLVATGS